MSSGLRIGRYELGERLGTGGFGVVYHARDTELGRELAIKVLRPEYQTQPDVVARFLKEARAAAKIDHPGIVTVFECGQISGTNTAQDGNAYIAMELLRGFSLTQHLERKGRMSAGDAVLVARQVAGALQVAHDAGIVHRDLKPDNVFLIPDPLVKGGFRIKILDFGVAKLAEPKEVGVNTHSQMMLGTPKYMSPEQARSARAVDARTDVYTLGCMLYEMVTGQPPYEGPGAIDMIIQHTTAPIPSAAEIVHGLPEVLDSLIRKMMEKEPEDRPESMKELDKLLGQIQAEVVPPSIPPTPMRAKPPTSPPAIPQRPSKPTPAPPTGLTPTPAVSMSATRPRPTPPPPISAQAARPPARPTPPPPMRPTPQPARPSAQGTMAESAPFAAAITATSLDEEVTTSAAGSRTEPRRSSRSGVLLLVVGLATAGLAAGVVWFVNREEKPAKSEPRATATPDASATPSKPIAKDDLEKLRAECRELEETNYWADLKACSERLKPYDPALAAKFWDKGEDEAANEKKWINIQQLIEKKDIKAARDLVKRIGDDSVYTERAHKLLEEADK